MSSPLHPDIERILISETEIAARIAELGRQITADFRGQSLYVVCILKGAFLFMADLIRHIDLPVEIGFIAVSSYGHATESSGVVRILQDLNESVEGKNVLLVEDIVDSGLTLNYLATLIANRGPKAIRICALTNKPQCHRKPINIDYSGFVLPSEFVVGYGLDFKDFYRNLPYIGVLKPAVYQTPAT